MTDNVYRDATAHAVHVLASYLSEHLLKRKRKADLATAELEIRDALYALIDACEKAGRKGADRSVTDTDLSAIEERLTACIDAVHDRIVALNGRVCSLEATRAGLDTIRRSANHALSNGERIEALEGRINRALKRLTALEARSAALSKRVDRLDK